AAVTFSAVSTTLSLFYTTPLGKELSQCLGAEKRRFNGASYVAEIGKENVQTLLLYALTQTPVQWDLKIGKWTIMQLAKSGCLTLITNGMGVSCVLIFRKRGIASLVLSNSNGGISQCNW